MKRIVTGVVTAALAAAIVLYLEPLHFVAAATATMVLAAAEYGALARRIVDSRTVAWALWLAVGVLAAACANGNGLIGLPLPADPTGAGVWFAAAAFVLALALAVGLGSRADVRDRLLTSSLFAFGVLWLGLFSSPRSTCTPPPRRSCSGSSRSPRWATSARTTEAAGSAAGRWRPCSARRRRSPAR